MSENTSGPAPRVKCEEQAYRNRFESAAFLQNAALCLLGYAPSEDPRDQLCVADGTALLWSRRALALAVTF